jgi:hypothetical protein
MARPPSPINVSEPESETSVAVLSAFATMIFRGILLDSKRDDVDNLTDLSSLATKFGQRLMDSRRSTPETAQYIPHGPP